MDLRFLGVGRFEVSFLRGVQRNVFAIAVDNVPGDGKRQTGQADEHEHAAPAERQHNHGQNRRRNRLSHRGRCIDDP